MRTRNQIGAAHLAGLLILALIAVIGTVGWVVDGRHKNKLAVSSNLVVKATSITGETPISIDTKSDIKKAIQVTDNSEIDGDLDTSGFDSDITSLR